ncbi:MAG: hypothetical protein F6K54_01575 [Okeania sp. SIO3B5]|uniref:hypothetical protein n=1 Tax=Okeania sp. SIO3B5 TaxID=2607811 RepID=UPI0013FF2B19|nr:hypothetical protein [Okeania sp. SIO3B5]NEO51892.1 hypothetical protein [Okeania sp. SIO3B5]
MPGYIKESNSDVLVQAVRSIQSELSALKFNFPDEITVKVPALETPPEPQELITGIGEMELIFMDKSGTDYPADLQPRIEPTVNEFRYHQFDSRDNLYQIFGNYVASNVQQVQVDLEAYNTENRTSLVAETKEKLRLPFTNSSSFNIPLNLYAEHLWTNTSSGSEIDWLEPVTATWKAGTDIVELNYRKGEYAVLFGGNQTWNINLSFSGIVNLPTISTMSQTVEA